MQNLEAKFKLADLERARQQGEAVGFSPRAVMEQRDTFFRVHNGKLKLREEDGSASLIYYGREDNRDFKLSHYEIVAVSDPDKLRAMLSEALGVIASVRKRRVLLQRDHIRLHLDRVEGLGDFGEIEAVLPADADPDDSLPAVEQLLAALGVDHRSLIGASYFEMMRPLR
jgi:predicted adenylyl cyclase CyaB